MEWNERRGEIFNGLLEWKATLGNKLVIANTAIGCITMASSEEEFLKNMEVYLGARMREEDDGVKGLLRVITEVVHGFKGEEDEGD